MKKILFSTLLMILALLPIKAQLRHVKGIGNFGVTYGISDHTNLFGAGYSHYFQPTWIWNVNVLYEKGNIESTELKNLIIQGGADYTCFRLNDIFYFNAGLGLFTGFEKLTGEETTEEVKNFTFGPSGNINVEIYLTSRFLFQVKAEQYYSPLSDLGRWFPVYSLSLKYCIF